MSEEDKLKKDIKENGSKPSKISRREFIVKSSLALSTTILFPRIIFGQECDLTTDDILGPYFIWIYNIMYKIVTSNSKVIVNHERLFDKKKSHLINASRLDEDWFKNYKNALLDKVRFLYVGRINPEKGILQFIKMLDKAKFDFNFSIVSNKVEKNISNKNIIQLGYVTDSKSLINIYDEHNIMILPSFTEASPYVLDESLSRRRPVIIFDDIEYIVRGKVGVFVSKRNIDSFSSTTKYIMDHYLEIQKNFEKNVLPTKKNMIKQISDIIENINS